MENGVMLQAFHWEYPDDGRLYRKLKEKAESLAMRGITAIWMPPAAKGNSAQDVGYGNYDYWDLGEFNQKGTVRTKYGSRQELEEAIQALHSQHIDVYADMVFNHKTGADGTERFQAVMVDQNDRNKVVSDPHEIEGWTVFDFPGRKGKYSDFQWHFNDFSGVDYDNISQTKAIYRILGSHKSWSSQVSTEMGNYDYLMGADIDLDNPEVVEELKKVADFMIDQLDYDGFRYDALKHISYDFIDELSQYILSKHPTFYFVGEYWNGNEGVMNHYLNETSYQVDLFDVALHFNFFHASHDEHYDIRKIFDHSLVQSRPASAVTFVDNHDSQPGQSLNSWVEPWFKEIAYALILFRQEGYPCLFLGDVQGIPSAGYEGMGQRLLNMVDVRRQYAYGRQDDYFVTPTKLGWVRRGRGSGSPLAVLISTGNMDQERMYVGRREHGRVYEDLSGKNPDITIDSEGYGLFTVPPGAVTYWARKDMGASYHRLLAGRRQSRKRARQEKQLKKILTRTKRAGRRG